MIKKKEPGYCAMRIASQCRKIDCGNLMPWNQDVWYHQEEGPSNCLTSMTLKSYKQGMPNLGFSEGHICQPRFALRVALKI